VRYRCTILVYYCRSSKEVAVYRIELGVAVGLGKLVILGSGGILMKISYSAIARCWIVLELTLLVDYTRLSSKSPPFWITSSSSLLLTSTILVL